MHCAESSIMPPQYGQISAMGFGFCFAGMKAGRFFQSIPSPATIKPELDSKSTAVLSASELGTL